MLPSSPLLQSPNRRGHLFIELEEYKEKAWTETGRWNHALEEEVVGGSAVGPTDKPHWSRPHLPTISFHALVQLRGALRTSNVMLDVPGSTFLEVVDHVLTRLVVTGELEVAVAPRVRDMLLGLAPSGRSPNAQGTSPGGPHANSPSRRLLTVQKSVSRERLPGQPPPPIELPSPLQRPSASLNGAAGSPMAVAPSPPAAGSSPLASATLVLPAACRSPPGALGTPPMTPPFSPGRSVAQREARNWYNMLSPDAGEEALDLLIAHVPFVEKPVMAFVRCASVIDAGCESHAPVRYLFLLIAPEREANKSCQMAHALAGCFLDEPFVAAVADATGSEAFLRLFDRHVQHVSILPHVHLPHHAGAPGGAASAASAGGAATIGLGSGHGSGLGSGHGSGHGVARGNSTDGSLISTSASVSPQGLRSGGGEASSVHGLSAEEEDEDEVVLAEVEDHLRSTQGLPRRESSVNGNMSHLGSLRRRPSSDVLNATVGSVNGADADAAQRAGRVGTPEGFAVSDTDRAGAVGRSATPKPAGAGMFIELEQCVEGVWSETHHWNWAFEQSARGGGGWSRHTLPKISAPALVALYEGLGEHNVLLDVPGTTFLEVAPALASALASSGALDPSFEPTALELLASRIGAVPHGDASLGVTSPRPDGDVIDLSPDGDEEACELLIAHTDIVRQPALAFARLQTPIQLGCEKAAPVRFIFALLAPTTQQERSVQVATAFAAVMLDEDFVSALRTCTSVPALTSLLGRQLECVTIVPHSHFRPSNNMGPTKGSSFKGEAKGGSFKTASFAQTLETSQAGADRDGTTRGGAHAPPRPPLRRASTLAQIVKKRVNRHGEGAPSWMACMRRIVFVVQRYSLPLVLGILVALVWANVDPPSYQ